MQKPGTDRRYQIHLKSHTGEIHVLLVNKDPTNNRPVVTPVPPPMTSSHQTPKEPAKTTIQTNRSMVDKIPEKQNRKPVPMETNTAGLLKIGNFCYLNFQLRNVLKLAHTILYLLTHFGVCNQLILFCFLSNNTFFTICNVCAQWSVPLIYIHQNENYV